MPPPNSYQPLRMGAAVPPTCRDTAMARLQIVWSLLRDAVRECVENKVLRLAAALAYYALFSLAPLLVLAVAVVGAVVGESAAESQVVVQLRGLAGDVAAQAVGELLGGRNAFADDLSTTAISIVGLLIGASALFNHLKDSLNVIWQVAPHPGRPLWRWVVDRLLALLMVLCVAVIALTGFGLSVELTALVRALMGSAPGSLPWYAVSGVQIAFALLSATLVVALTYRLLPDTHIAWRDIWIGASVTALLIVASQALIGLYLRSGLVGTAYSIVGAVVLILAWVYYCALIFFFGAELTWAYASRFGARIVPAPGALSLSAGDRAAQGLRRTAEL